MNRMILLLMGAAALLAAAPGCTDNSGDATLAEQAGREAAHGITKPIEKARTVDSLSRERVREMDAVQEAE